MVAGPLIAHDYPTLLEAAIQGVGLAQVPRPLVTPAIAEGRLQVVLSPFSVTAPGVFLYHRADVRFCRSCAPSSSTSDPAAPTRRASEPRADRASVCNSRYWKPLGADAVHTFDRGG